jgi:hypothetical protein
MGKNELEMLGEEKKNKLIRLVPFVRHNQAKVREMRYITLNESTSPKSEKDRARKKFNWIFFCFVLLV